MNKKGFSGILIIGLILLVGTIIGIVASGKNPVADITGAVGSGGYIERLVCKYVKCEPLSGLKYSEFVQVGYPYQWLNKPSVSSSYNVKVRIDNIPFTLGYTQIKYSVCNSRVESSSNCRMYNLILKKNGNKGEIFSIDGIKQNEVVLLEYQKCVLGCSSASGLSYQIGFIPYGLREYDVLSGSSNPINPNDCTIPSNDDSWVDRFISSDSAKINSQISKNTNERTLQPEEVRWYVSGYVTSAGASFVLKYKNQDAWCRTTGTSAEIYKINKVVLASGTYKIASPDWSDYLGAETCCPKSTRGDEVCNSKFQWEKIAGSECGTFKSCGSLNWVPYSEKQIIKYSCVNGYCKAETKSVECASDYDCKDSNEVCDLNNFECVDANVNLKGQKIETIPDNKADCEQKGGTWITQSTTKNKATLLCPFGLFGFCQKQTIVNEYCDMGEWDWWKIFSIGFIIIAIGVGIFLLIKKFTS